MTKKYIADKFQGQTIEDTSGNEAIEIPATASAVNYVEIKNAATGNPVEINAKGSDLNIGLEVNAKGLAFTKVKVLRNNDSLFNYVENSVFITGWGFIQGDGASGYLEESVSFSKTLSEIPILNVTLCGTLSGSDPSSIGDFNAAPFVTNNVFNAGYYAPTTTGFTVALARQTGSFASTIRYGYSWMAIGQLN